MNFGQMLYTRAVYEIADEVGTTEAERQRLKALWQTELPGEDIVTRITERFKKLAEPLQRAMAKAE